MSVLDVKDEWLFQGKDARMHEKKKKKARNIQKQSNSDVKNYTLGPAD